MAEISPHEPGPVQTNANLARDHLANERTFLAWVRTSIAIVVFGFALGRFAIALRQWLQFEGHGRSIHTSGASVWFGALAILAGVAVCLVGLDRYRRTRAQLAAGRFEPAGSVIDLIAVLTALFGLALGAYLVYIEFHL
ncbi:MAG TPA: DUF202 domain-containing protein [Candidatus Acidoferrum sp.]|nr:DUF202 domain-containing protein [Candidatus Acidoferrum sp.]